MRSFDDVWNRVSAFLTAGIAGSAFTPLRVVVVIAMTWALVWVTRRASQWFVNVVLARRGFDVGLREALGATLRYTVISLGVLVILQSAGIDLTSLNVLVGAVGVGLGFGLQNIASNFFSGLILLFERPIKIGDRIEISGVVGEVREIGARATTIVTDENVASIVPNSQLVTERVTNWSRPTPLTAYLLPFSVSHTSDPTLVRDALLGAARAHVQVMQEPAPEVEFVEVGPAVLRFQLQVWSSQSLRTAGTFKSDLNFAIWKQLASIGVTIQEPKAAVVLGLQLAGARDASRAV